MKIKFWSFLILVFAAFGMQAQVNERFKKKGEEKPKEKVQKVEKTPKENQKPVIQTNWDNLVYGGNLSLAFGTNTFVYIAPTVGYKVTDKFIPGAGFIYQYAKYDQAYNAATQSFQSFEFESQIYGPKFLINYIPNDYVYGGIQFEYLNHDVANFVTRELDRDWTSVLFLELGLVQPIGKKGFVQIGMKYNVLHDFDSPYASPLIPSIGFFF